MGRTPGTLSPKYGNIGFWPVFFVQEAGRFSLRWSTEVAWRCWVPKSPPRSTVLNEFRWNSPLNSEHVRENSNCRVATWQPCWIKWNPVLGRVKPPCLPLESYFAVASPSRIFYFYSWKRGEIPIFLWLPIHVDSPQIMDGSKILIFCQTKRAGDELTREMRTGERWSLPVQGKHCGGLHVENSWGNSRKMLDVFFFPHLC